MSKDKWKQVSGDVNWSSHGVVLARDTGDSIEMVSIEPWIEHDSEALLTHGLYIVDSGYFDYDELGEGELPGTLSEKIQSALRSVGMDEDEYAKLEPAHKADVLRSYEGLGGESESTNNLLGALPDKPENIEFWQDKATKQSVLADNESMRREAIRAIDPSLDEGELPSDEYLELAIGSFDQCVEFDFTGNGSDFDDNDRTAVGFVVKYDTSKPVCLNIDDFKKLVSALWAVPTFEELTQHDRNKLISYFPDLDLDEEDRMEHFANEIAEQAHDLARRMIEQLGFHWS